MDADLTVQNFIILKGFIDAKDDRGHTWYGTFLGVVSRRDTKYLSVMFSREESSKSLDWREILMLHNEKEKSPGRDPAITHHEYEVYKYLERSMVLNGVAKNHNTKQAEQAISRYCLESLYLKTVSFIDYTEATEGDLELFEQAEVSSAQSDTQPEEDAPVDGTPEEPAAQAPDGTGTDSGKKEEIFLRCDPILDPVNGVAMNELTTGDYVFGRLPEDSVFFKLLAKNIRGFDGVVTAQVTGILVNELGTATISLNLSDGVSGVMKLSGKVRIKTAQKEKKKDGMAAILARFKFSELPPEVVLGAAGLIVAASLIALLFYIFSG
jgi:hypothetical protein